jgi:hypothetical protein
VAVVAAAIAVGLQTPASFCYVIWKKYYMVQT